MIASLAWRNIWRQPTRTGLSLTGMAFASMLLVFMLSFQFGSYDSMKANILRIIDGYGQIQPPGYKDDPEITKVIGDPSGLIAELESLPQVTTASARANGYVLLANGERSFAAAVAGVDPAREVHITRIASLIKQGRPLRADDDAAIVLGEALARNLRLKVGDRVTLLGTAMDGSVAADVLKVVGIFRTGITEIDRQIAHMPLNRFRETFVMDGAVNEVAIIGRDLRDIINAEPRLRAIAARHNAVYLNWGQLQPAVKQAITLDMTTASLMYGTLVIVVVFIILNTLYMSVLERTREFGVLLAVGMKPGQIGRMVWMEIIFLSLVGTGIGIVLGMALAWYFGRIGITFEGMQEIFSQWGLPPRIYPRMTPFRVLAGPGAIILLIALLGIIPYRRVLGLEPVKAMNA